MITHNGAYGTTVYELKHGEDTLLQGRIKYIVSQEAEEQKTKISLEGEVFEEGKNILHVFMEDEEGNVIPEYDETIEIRIDTQSPTVTLEAAGRIFYLVSEGSVDSCGIRRWCMGKPG